MMIWIAEQKDPSLPPYHLMTCYKLGRCNCCKYRPEIKAKRRDHVFILKVKISWELEEHKEIKKLGEPLTWKQAECIKWPQDNARTDSLDVKRKSQQMGQFVSKPFSRHLWSTNFTLKQQLQVMQWKKSEPSPLPSRHKLQKGQW